MKRHPSLIPCRLPASEPAYTLTRLLLYLVAFNAATFVVSGLRCGYPGSPTHGRPNLMREEFDEGETVTYTCDTGYFLLGPPTRKCQPSGQWSGRIPLCDTSLSSPGTAEISQTLSEYPAALAIDGNVATCAVTTRRAPRWWRLDLGRSYRILSVGVTINAPSSDQNFKVFILGLRGNSAIYQPCSTFNGKFASSSVILVCGEGRGLDGRYIHIEDNRKELAYFTLCEVEVMVVKEKYDCGQPERPAQSYTVRMKPEQVEYRCLSGYKLEGTKRRHCLKNGQWSDAAPLCREVKCQDLNLEESSSSFSGGSVKVLSARRSETNRGGRATVAILGSVAQYSCDEGFVLRGNGTRECLDNGTWSGQNPKCQPVDCGDPNKQTNLKTRNGNDYWKFELVTGSTLYGSLARLTCPDEQGIDGHASVNIRCKDDGAWSKPKAKCATLVNGMESAFGATDQRKDDPLQNTGVSIGLIVGMIGAVVVATVALIYFLLRRRSRQKSESHRNGISQASSTTTNSSSSSGLGSCQSLMRSSSIERLGVGGLLYHSGRGSSNKKTQTADEGYYSEPKGRPTPISLISNGHYDYPKRAGTQMLPPKSASVLIAPPDYSFQIIPTSLLEKGGRLPSVSSNGSRENIYEEITLGCRKKSSGSENSRPDKKSDHPTPKPEPKTKTGAPVNVSALYATVDFDKKREGRMKRQTRMAPDGASDSTDNTPQRTTRNERTLNQLTDSPSAVYRELPPIPPDEDYGSFGGESKTNDDSLGQRSAASSAASTVFTIIDNDLYGDDSLDKMSESVMVDNELYNSTKSWT